MSDLLLNIACVLAVLAACVTFDAPHPINPHQFHHEAQK